MNMQEQINEIDRQIKLWEQDKEVDISDTEILLKTYRDLLNRFLIVEHGVEAYAETISDSDDSVKTGLVATSRFLIRRIKGEEP